MHDHDRIQQLHAAAGQTDKAELSLLHNAVLDRMKAYQASSTAANRKDWQDAKLGLAELVETLWPRYFPGERRAVAGSDDLWFKTKGDAFCWYAEQGGQRQKSSFYATVAADGKRVSRLVVSEMLRKERQSAPAGADLTARREDADTRKAEADAAKAEMQAEEMRRELDSKWLRREAAEEETCVWVSRLRDASAYQLGRSLLALIHACGGDPARLSEAQAIVDAALSAACNEIAESGELTVEVDEAV